MERPEIKIDKRRYNTKEEYQREYHKEYAKINDTGLKCEGIRRKTPIKHGEKDAKSRRRGLGKCGNRHQVVTCPHCLCDLCKSCFNNKEIHGCAN